MTHSQSDFIQNRISLSQLLTLLCVCLHFVDQAMYIITGGFPPRSFQKNMAEWHQSVDRENCSVSPHEGVMRSGHERILKGPQVPYHRYGNDLTRPDPTWPDLTLEGYFLFLNDFPCIARCVPIKKFSFPQINLCIVPVPARTCQFHYVCFLHANF